MSNLDTFFGKPVKDFAAAGDIALSAAVAPRVRVDYDDAESCADRLSKLLDEPGIEAVEALVIGSWAGDDSQTSSDALVAVLAARAGKLPNLRALFIGDITGEENEMSWIEQSDMSALWAAYPKLEEFGARGGNSLKLGTVRHDALRKLVIETGGMPASLLGEALAVDAPIEDFEVWTGADDYGDTTKVEQFADLFAGKTFPNLRRLALLNSEKTDEIAEAIAAAPVMDRIRELDLGMGTLTDRGAKALLAGGKLGRLERFSIDHHYVSDTMLAELRLATRELVAGEQLEPDEWGDEEHYYIAVSE